MNGARYRGLAAAYVIAIAVGASLALVAAASPRTIAMAATHCTNYFPISYGTDTLCNNMSTITNGTWGQTGSTALRDSNCMLVQNNRSLQVWYGEYAPASSYSTNLCQGASPGYQRAGCKLVSGGAVTGRCRTDWHN